MEQSRIGDLSGLSAIKLKKVRGNHTTGTRTLKEIVFGRIEVDTKLMFQLVTVTMEKYLVNCMPARHGTRTADLDLREMLLQ